MSQGHQTFLLGLLPRHLLDVRRVHVVVPRDCFFIILRIHSVRGDSVIQIIQATCGAVRMGDSENAAGPGSLLDLFGQKAGNLPLSFAFTQRLNRLIDDEAVRKVGLLRPVETELFVPPRRGEEIVRV